MSTPPSHPTRPARGLWKPGDPIESPVSEMVAFDVNAIGPAATYKLLVSAIVPRPIAFVSTVNSAGVGNLAPFSFFNGVSSEPPCLIISCARNGDGSKKDTLRNIEETRQFVVNSVAEWMVEPMHHTSANYPYGVDEMKKSGLTPLLSTRVKPMRVQESPIHLECELEQLVEIGEPKAGSTTLIIGRIVMMHVHAAAYRNGRIMIDEIKPVSRLGGSSYSLIGETFDLERPRFSEDALSSG